MARGRPKTGHVQWRGGEWKTRVTDKATELKKWVGLEDDLPLSERLKKDQWKLARQLARILQEKWVSGGYVPCERNLTVNEFFPRWVDSRRLKFPNQVTSDEIAFRLWIGPELGTLSMHAVSRDRLIAFSHHLDKKALDGTDFRGKRALNIFSVVAAMFRDAHKSKNAALRILDANPCDGVPWPDKPTGEPIYQLLYPNEFLALVSCPDVPVVRARLYAIALYTATRIGEARVLECDHVDIAHRLVKILKAADRGSGKTKLPKSNKSRITTLEPTLEPLIDRMIVERGGKGRLFLDRPLDMPKGNQHLRVPVEHIPGTSKVCEVFRKDLKRALEWAGIKERPELFDFSDLRASHPIRFHELRASGITWRHARGDNPSVIRQECGHEDEATNEIYIRRLRELRPDDLFPPMPERLAGSPGSGVANKDQIKTSGLNSTPENPPNQCRRRESNTVPAGAKTRRIVTNCDEAPVSLSTIRDDSSPFATSPVTVADNLAAALQLAAKAGQWEVVNELSRQLAELRRDVAGPPVRAVPGKR